jgi:hypothetical protein
MHVVRSRVVTDTIETYRVYLIIPTYTHTTEHKLKNDAHNVMGHAPCTKDAIARVQCWLEEILVKAIQLIQCSDLSELASNTDVLKANRANDLQSVGLRLNAAGALLHCHPIALTTMPGSNKHWRTFEDKNEDQFPKCWAKMVGPPPGCDRKWIAMSNGQYKALTREKLPAIERHDKNVRQGERARTTRRVHRAPRSNHASHRGGRGRGRGRAQPARRGRGRARERYGRQERNNRDASSRRRGKRYRDDPEDIELIYPDPANPKPGPFSSCGRRHERQ